jgi:hypothetical protein
MRGSLWKTVPLELTMNEHAIRLINMRQPNTLNSACAHGAGQHAAAENAGGC